jgi:hypothetical protein
MGSIRWRPEDSLLTILGPLAATLIRIADGVLCAIDFRMALSLAADFRRARF